MRGGGGAPVGRGAAAAEPLPIPQLGGPGAIGREPGGARSLLPARCWETWRSRRRPSVCWMCKGDGPGIESEPSMVEPSWRGGCGRGARLGVSAASLCHLAWAQWWREPRGERMSCSGRCCSGGCRAARGVDRAMGMFINTLPVRIRLEGRAWRQGCARTHALLADLLRHEHASLALAQRCSAVPAPTPLFSALLNYRYSTAAGRRLADTGRRAWEGIEELGGEERTNYPVHSIR